MAKLTVGARIVWRDQQGTIRREAKPLSIYPDEPSYIVQLDGGLSIRVIARQVKTI